MELYKSKLEELKTKIEQEGVISKNDILSLESAFETTAFSDSMNVSLLSNVESATGVEDVLKIINSELVRDFTVSQEDVAQNYYGNAFIINMADPLRPELSDRLTNVIKDIICLRDQLQAPLSRLVESKFLKNVMDNILTIEVEGKFYKIGETPLEILAYLDSSWLYQACGNNDEEFEYMRTFFAGFDKFVKERAGGFNKKYDLQILTSYHFLKHYIDQDLGNGKSIDCSQGLPEDIYHFVTDFKHTEASGNIHLAFLLVSILLYYKLDPKRIQSIVYWRLYNEVYQSGIDVDIRKKKAQKMANAIAIISNLTSDLANIYNLKK